MDRALRDPEFRRQIDRLGQRDEHEKRSFTQGLRDIATIAGIVLLGAPSIAAHMVPEESVRVEPIYAERPTSMMIFADALKYHCELPDGGELTMHMPIDGDWSINFRAQKGVECEFEGFARMQRTGYRINVNGHNGMPTHQALRRHPEQIFRVEPVRLGSGYTYTTEPGAKPFIAAKPHELKPYMQSATLMGTLDKELFLMTVN